MSHLAKIEKIFQQMLEIEGILGIILFNFDGEILGWEGTSELDEAMIVDLCILSSAFIESLRDFGITDKEICFNHKQKRIVIKELQSAVFIVVNRESVNSSMISIAYKIAVRKLNLLAENYAFRGNDEDSEFLCSNDHLSIGIQLNLKEQLDKKGHILFNG